MLLQGNVIAIVPGSVKVLVKVNKHFETTLNLDASTPGFSNVCEGQEIRKEDRLNLAARFYPTKPPEEQLEIIRITKLIPKKAVYVR